MQKIDLTTKITKDTKVSEILFLNFVLFVPFVVKDVFQLRLDGLGASWLHKNLPTRKRTYRFALTRQIFPAASSATSNEPSVQTATPAGRP